MGMEMSQGGEGITGEFWPNRTLRSAPNEACRLRRHIDTISFRSLVIKAALSNSHAQHIPGLGLRPASIDDWEKIRETHVGKRFDLSDTEMSFVINLDQPLDSQLRSIGRIAHRDQERLTKAGLVTVSKPRDRGKYVDYLRLLDARDSRVNRLKIEEKLFPATYSNDQRGKTYNNYLKVAEKLRDDGYKALAAAAF
jgi:hypothetical protein